MARPVLEQACMTCPTKPKAGHQQHVVVGQVPGKLIGFVDLGRQQKQAFD